MLAGRIVEGETLSGIEGATIVVTAASRGSEIVVSGMTEDNGRFAYSLPPGRYDILAVFDDARWVKQNVEVVSRRVTQVPGVLSVGAEVITVHEKTGQKVTPATVDASTVKPQLEYSDEAIDENAWAVGWVLLNVDERGMVTGFKFLHRPAHSLDAIAEKEIWRLRFNPAHDANGRPMASRVLWKLEWPAYHWARDHQLFGRAGPGALMTANMTAAMLDAAPGFQNITDAWARAIVVNEGPGGGRLSGNRSWNAREVTLPPSFTRPGIVLPGEYRLPCKDSPLALDGHQPIYRDCSLPDLSKVNSEPLIPRPVGQ